MYKDSQLFSFVIVDWSAGKSRNVRDPNVGNVTLHCVDTKTGVDGYWLPFPVTVTRARRMGDKEAGSYLGDRKFRLPSQRTKFFKFWVQTMCLKPPLRGNGAINLSGFSDCMGRLINRHILATVKDVDTKKIDNDSVQNADGAIQISDNYPTNTLQVNNISQTKISDKELNNTEERQGESRIYNPCTILPINHKSVNNRQRSLANNSNHITSNNSEYFDWNEVPLVKR